MKIARHALALGLLVSTGALADEPDFYQPDLDRLEGTLARVQLPKANFYSGDEKPGCPAMTLPCRRAAYLRSGDVVLVRKPKGVFVEADFTTGGARSTNGWLARSSLAPMPAPAATLAGWRGDWVRDDEASIAIEPGKRPGSLVITGDASWGTHDPERVKRGGINVGELEEAGMPKGDRLSLGSPEGFDCRLRIRQIGPYLVVADNNKCGGMNVSFSGVYRHPAGGKRP